VPAVGRTFGCGRKREKEIERETWPQNRSPTAVVTATAAAAATTSGNPGLTEQMFVPSLRASVRRAEQWRSWPTTAPPAENPATSVLRASNKDLGSQREREATGLQNRGGGGSKRRWKQFGEWVRAQREHISPARPGSTNTARARSDKGETAGFCAVRVWALAGRRARRTRAESGRQMARAALDKQ
jgi:hypothetical protein